MRDIRIKQIIDFLSIRCDYATAIDGAGFNKIDAGLGHGLSELPFENWSDRQVYVAYKMIRKYKNQYATLWNYEDITVPLEPATLEKPQIENKEAETIPEGYRIVKAKGKSWTFEFSYSKEMVSVIKENFQYRKYDPENKVWTIPIRVDEIEIEDFLKFIEKYNFEKDVSFYEKLNEIGEQFAERLQNVKRSYANNTEFQVEGLKKELRPFQKAGVEYVLRNERVIIGDEMGLGKAQPLTAKILTPKGFVLMKDILVGQDIINSQGRVSQVTGVFPQGIKKVYEVEFSDGAKTKCTDEHLWTVNTALRKWYGSQARLLELQQFKNDLFTTSGNTKYFIPIVKPIHFNDKKVLIHPYLLGVLLGDGGLAHRTIISTGDTEILEFISPLLPLNMSITKSKSKYDYCLVYKKGARNPLREYLKKLGLHGLKSKDKFIPQEYLINSIDKRINLLCGLMDTDGYVSKDGCITQFSSSSNELIEGVRFLVQSLGGTVKQSSKLPKGGQRAYTLTLSLPKGLIPFRLSRKVKRFMPKTKYLPYRGIRKVTYLGEEETQCIRVNAPDSLYITDEFILTHNTIQTIASIHAKDLYPALIICPASLKLNWKREFESWINRRSVFIVNGKSNSTALYCDVVVINYDIVKKHKDLLSQIDFKTIVMDESHYLKNYKAQRTEAVKELAKKIPYRVALSGTAILNRPSELISQLTILNRLTDFGGFTKFTQRYCNAFKDRFGLNISGATNLEELNEKLRMICYIRRTKSEVLKELPEKQRAIVPIELTNRAEYDKAEEDLISYLQEKALADKEFLDSISHLSEAEQELAKNERAMSVEEKTRRAEQLVRIEALKQCCVNGKIEGAIEWIDNFLESGEKLVVFATHRDIINKLSKKYNAPKITGDTTSEDRQKAVDMFQTEPDCKLIFLNIKAGGVGLTLTASSNVTFLELDWTPASMSQAEDRCHRIGQINSVTAWYLLADDSIDNEIYALLQEKERIVNGVLEGTGDEVNVSIMKELLSKIQERSYNKNGQKPFQEFI
jgi:hypothetical protein